MPVKVFGSPTSAEAARVLACLFEKDVEFQLIRVDSFRGPKRLPQYLKLQVLSQTLQLIVPLPCTRTRSAGKN